jgi:cell division protein FtsN
MSNTPTRQTGGTFLGMVIGLLVGLAVALGVAVYVTKVPVPFIDRGVLSNPSQDQAEAQKNKNWNPNAEFNQNGSPSTAPAAGVSATAPVVTETPTNTPPTDAASLAPSSTSNDPLGDLMQQKASEPAPLAARAAVTASAGQVSELVFFVQAGAYGQVQDAEAQRAKLAILGVDARVSSDQSNGQTVHRVRSGPYKTRAAALATRQRLSDQKIESLVVAVPK